MLCAGVLSAVVTATTTPAAFGARPDSEKPDSARPDGAQHPAPDDHVTRLAASMFPELPAAIRAELDRRACTVPQSYVHDAAHNVISGHFTSATAVDWAVLCSHNRASSVLVFRGGAASRVSEFGKLDDSRAMRSLGDGRVGFMRTLAVATPLYIEERHARDGGPPLPKIDHDGIADDRDGKSPAVWWSAGGRWMRLNPSIW